MNSQKFFIASAISLGLVCGVATAQPVAGTATLGVSATEVQAVASGWSLKDSILGKTVHNDGDESVGKVEDVIVAPDGTVSYAILSVGGFLGMGAHDVAIPVKNFRINNDKITLAGATKDALKTLPKFEYAKK
ncbi:PRC-barrel domain containing protein [Lampropedia puyangensis]|uniref:PRC-barrel domain containing protein n=1 Tax=Lampropedia puyangensis TaxID=1330072 RepID=A0A4S8EV67_9BURK|nr:PRC-barrel domain-containing protein [Lampropedia puyangensis]THT98662.1 PRC-barrel domain containing protein [Lampropedia puyangensis]